MAETGQKATADEYESTLRRVQDILTARVVLDPSGAINEIHILASPGRSVKHVLRDACSSLMAAFGNSVHPSRISISQLDEGVLLREKRVQLLRVGIVSEIAMAEVNVHLKMDDNEVLGTARGTPTAQAWLRLAAEATVNAIGQYLPQDAAFSVQDVAVHRSRESRIALALVLCRARGEDRLLTGCCPVTYDDREAVVKATLHAVNRKFAQIMAGGG